MIEAPQTISESRINRLYAQLNGSARYIGRPCRKCGGRVRYMAKWRCVRCHYAAEKERDRAKYKPKAKKLTARQQAMQEGRTTYHGQPCAICGGTERYVSTMRCRHVGKASHGAIDRDPRRHVYLSAEDIALAYEAHLAGLSTQELAHKFECHYRTMLKHLRQEEKRREARAT